MNRTPTIEPQYKVMTRKAFALFLSKVWKQDEGISMVVTGKSGGAEITIWVPNGKLK